MDYFDEDFICYEHVYQKVNVVDQIRILVICLWPKLMFTLKKYGIWEK